MWFIGSRPHRGDGTPMTSLDHSEQQQNLGGGIVVDRSFSQKPVGRSGYTDFYEKVTVYAQILQTPAQQLDPSVTARTYRVYDAMPGTGPFLYADTATARAGIGAINERLSGMRIAIIGLGGTGSHVLDLLAKTQIDELHLYDDDRFVQHNAFRAPGSYSKADLESGPAKVALLAERYALMRTGVVAHPYRIGETNVSEVTGFDMVFVCIDSSTCRGRLADALIAAGQPFIDVGLGVLVDPEQGSRLRGQVRTTACPRPASAPGTDGPSGRAHLPSAAGQDDIADDVYRSNVQLVELNAINAALAVLRFKRLAGIYVDEEPEYNSVYVIEANTLVNDR
jgi:ThiF family